MRIRIASASILSLTIACAGQQVPTGESPPPAAAAEPQAKAPEPKPDDTPKQIEAAKSSLESATASLREAAAALADKKVTAPQFERAREALGAVDKSLADAKALEAKDETYAKAATEARAELEKTRAAVEARWLEVGAALSRTAIDDSAKQAMAAAKGTPDFAKIEAAMKQMGAQIENAAKIESKDPKYSQFLAAKKQQLAGFQKWFDQNRQKAATQAQQDRVNKAKAAADAKIAALKTGPDDAAFEAAESAIGALEGALGEGKPIEEKDPAYLKFANGVRAAAERGKAAIAQQRSRQKLDLQKKTVESQRKAVAETIKALGAAPESFDALEKAIAELEHAIEAGKELAASDKSYAQYAAAVTKEIAVQRSVIERLRQQAAIRAHKKAVESAAAELELRKAAAQGNPSPESIAAAEEASTALDKVLKDGEPLAAKDKAHAAFLQSVAKKLGDQRASIAKSKTVQQVGAHRAEVQAAQAKVDQSLAALVGKLDHDLYQGAEDAISALEKSLASGEEIASADPKYAQELKTHKDRLPAMRMQIRRRWVEAANASVGERIKALDGGPGSEPDDKSFAAAKEAVRVLGNTVESAKSFTTQDKGYLAFVASMEKLVPAYRAKIEQRRIGLKVQKHRAVVEAAAKTVEERIKALDQEAKPAAFDGAESSVTELKNAIESADAETTAEKGHAAFLAAEKKKSDLYAAQIAKKRIDVAVAEHRQKVAEATGAVTERWKALASAPTDAKFEAVEEAVAALEKVLGELGDAAEKDAKYQKEITVAKSRIPAYRANIEKKKTEVAIAAHRAKIEAAAAAAAKALSGSDVGEADQAVAEVESALAEGEALAGKDQKHAALILAIKKKLPEQKALLARKKIEQKVAAHRTEVQGLKAKVAERLKALQGKLEAPLYQAAEASIAELSSAISAGDEIAGEDPKYGKELKALKDEIPADRMLVRRRLVEAATGDAVEKIKALQGEADSTAFSSAADAVAALAKAVEGAKHLDTRDKTYLSMIAAAEKQVPAFTATIKQRLVSLAVRKHRARVEAASMKLAEKVKAVSAPDPSSGAFDEADAAVLELENTLKPDDETAAGDKSHQAYLAGEHKKAAAAAAVIGKRRSDVALASHKKERDAAVAAVSERLKSLEKEPSDTAFASADEAVAALGRILSSGGPLAAKDPKYGKELASMQARLPAFRAAIERRKKQLVVDAHRKELDPALKAVSERLDALKGKPESAAFEAAESAVSNLKGVLESGTEAAKQDPKYAARLAALLKRIGDFHAVIERRRFDAEVADQRAKIAEADKELAQRVSGLEKKAEAESFVAVDDAIGRLESAIAEGKPFAEKNKAYEKELVQDRKKIGVYKARIAKSRYVFDRDQHKVRLDVAEAALVQQLRLLAKGSDQGALDQSKEALASLVKEIDAGTRFAKDDKKHLKRLLALKKDLPKHRAQIESARFELEVKGQREAVEAATQEAEKRVASLEGGVTPEGIKAAESGVEELENAIRSGQAIAKKNKAHAKWLAAHQKRIAVLKATIGRRAVEGEVKAHRTEVQEARAEVKEQLKGLQGQLEYTLYQHAEEALDKMKKVIDAGAPLAEKDDAYAKQLAAAAKEIEVDRVAMRRTWIEAADAAVVEKVKALSGNPDAAAFHAADAALKVLGNTIESGKGLSQDKSYLKFYASAERRAQSHRAIVERRRSESEFSGVRADLDQAVKDAAAKMSAVSGDEPDPEAVEAAAAALSALEQSIDANVPAAEKDKLHQKKLVLLRKKLGQDRAKVERLRTAASMKPQREKLAAAEATFKEKMAALKGQAGSEALEGAEQAVAELESALDESKSITEESKKAKKHALDLRKRIEVARASIKSKKGEARFAEHREKVEAALADAKEKVSGLGKDSDRDAVRAAEDSVRELGSVIDSGKNLGKKDKKYAAFLAAARKTSKDYQAALKRKRPAPEVDAGASRLESAQAAVREKFKALGSKPDTVLLTDARAALDGLESALEEAKAEGKKSKSYAKKVFLAKEQLAKGRKKLAKLDAASSRSGGGGSGGGGGEVAGETKVAEAWSQFIKRVKAFKGATPSSSDIEGALEAADEVDRALKEGDSSRAGKTAKYKKYAAAIKKKLKKERGKLKKLRSQVQYSSRR